MPTRYRFRERLGFPSNSGSRPNSRSTSPAPPLVTAQAPALNSTLPALPVLPVTSPIQPTATPPTVPLPPSLSAPVENTAFVSALKEHIDSLSPEERQAFNDSSTTTPEALIVLIQHYDETHNQESRSRRCVSRVEGFLKAVNGYLKPVSIMTSHSPEFSSLAVGAVKLIVQLGLDFAAFFNKLTEMMEDIAGHLGYLSKYVENFKHCKEVQNALSSAYGDLLRFCTGARNVFVDKKGNPSRWVSFRIFLKVMWEPFEETFNTLNTQFRNHVDIVIRTAAITEHERLISKEILEAEEKEDENRHKLLSWLSDLDFDMDHNRIFSKRHQDTGNWLIDSTQFKCWDNAKSSSLLWCYGTPGVGKSVLASLVLDTISTKYSLDSRVGIAFIYFNFQDQVSQKPTKILSTIIQQLARQKKILPNGLKQFYKKYYRDASFPTEEKLDAQLLDLSKEFDQVFLIIDAMDEFEDRKGFLSILTRFTQEISTGNSTQNSSTRFKMFVTSRREEDIETTFTKGDFPTIQIEAQKVDADIASFVRYQIERRVGKVSIDQRLKDEIEEGLISKSSGMFLWVKYQLDYIYGQPSIKDIKVALESLPSDMNATYIRILEKIDRELPSIKKIAKRALQWVVSAGRPLTLRELACVVSIEPESTKHKELELYDEQTVLSACANLLTVEDEIVRPVHYTVQEFLSTPQANLGPAERSIHQRYQSTIGAHERLAHICLQYLLFDDIIYAKYMGRNWYNSQYPFLLYTAKYWHYHVQILPVVPEDLSHNIDKLLYSSGNSLKAAYYMQIYNPDDFVVHEVVNPLTYCLSLGILHLYQNSVHSSAQVPQEYKEALHYAAQGGSISTIRALLKMRMSVNIPDTRGNLPLGYSSRAGHQGASEFLLESGADINGCSEELGSALAIASQEGHKIMLEMLIDKGADVNAQGGRYGNPLQAAAYGGYDAIVQTLLDKGADVNAQGGYFGNALQAAANGGYDAILQTLLDKGADVNAQGGYYGNALQAAANGGYDAIAQTLLDKGADVNAQGGYYGNPLQAAADGGYDAIAQTLLDKGADVNAQGGYYGNPLQAAAYGGYDAIVQTLLDKGADVNAQGGYFGNALQAAASGGYDAILQTLLDKGADVNAQGGYYGNPLQAAADGGYDAIVQTLLDKGADVNAQGGYYGNALQAAADGGYDAIAQTLLDKGADVNAQGGYYGNALQAAAFGGYDAIVQTLLDKGADVNAQGGRYGNALQAAAFGGYDAILQTLLDKGADVNAQGGYYGNALQAANSRGAYYISQLLRSAGAQDTTNYESDGIE